MSIPSNDTANRWNHTLKYFRFQFAHGGHANDMDVIVGSVRFVPGEAGLLDLLTKLEVPLERIRPDMPRRVPGRAYNSADLTRYAEPIPAYPAFQAPGLVRLFGKPACLSVFHDWVAIYLAGADGDLWSVTEADFRQALHLETLFAECGIEFVDDPYT